jgi:hypothetical protein
MKYAGSPIGIPMRRWPSTSMLKAFSPAGAVDSRPTRSSGSATLTVSRAAAHRPRASAPLGSAGMDATVYKPQPSS